MNDLSLLVVDGFLNSKSGVAQVKLSRSLPLDVTTEYPEETGAQVRIENESGVRFTLVETSPGTYEALRNDLTVGSSYRMLLTTRSGNDYISDYVVLKQSPELEDVSWSVDGDGITIHVDARDPSGSTRYYQWLYTETWEYDSDRESGWFVQNGFAVDRNLSGGKIHICYTTVESSKVLISTTSDQTGDLINDFPLVHIPAGSRKLSRHYSILVQQRALDESSYNYWQQLQRTTESLGGLFDPLPSRVTGNIRATGTSQETVLGYFSGGGVEEKRIYINFIDLPLEQRYVNRRFCPIDSVEVANLRNYVDGQGLVAPYGSPFVVGYTLASPDCMDCRYDGGILNKPPYWPF